jgi:hypothetical protein
MLFLRAKVIPVNPQIHGNVMCPLFVLNFIFEPVIICVNIVMQKTTQILPPVVDRDYRLSNFWLAKEVNKELKKELWNQCL